MLETGSLLTHVDVPICTSSEGTERLDVVQTTSSCCWLLVWEALA
jgi:hypothetical protein